jgi:hypothetical protein
LTEQLKWTTVNDYGVTVGDPMPRIATGFGLVALIFALMVVVVAPASAEFFGFDDQHPARTTSYHAYSHAPSYARVSRYTDEFAAQRRPRITIRPRQRSPGRHAKRYCRSWLAQEYRISGPVIVPRMQCWWQ